MPRSESDVFTVDSICHKDGFWCRYALNKMCKVPSIEVAQRKTVVKDGKTTVASCEGYDGVRVIFDET